MRPCIDFLITQMCNYRCEYCSQSKKFAKNTSHADDDTINAFLNFLKTVDKNFEITISGGEPLLHPRFFEVAQEIKNLGLKLSVISNFSFPSDYYERLINTMGENLTELFVSFHSTQVKNVEEFKKKVRKISSIKPSGTDFTVASVLRDDNVEILEDLSDFLEKTGVKFCLQHMRVKNKYVEYDKKAAEFLVRHAEKEPGRSLKTFGKLCHAGSKFLIIYQNGEAYRCYSSRFNKGHGLGNIKDKNFKIFKKAEPCLNFKCTCPKPVYYGMLDTKRSNYLKAGVGLAVNCAFLPLLMFKKFDVLHAKFKQGKFLKK